MERAKVLPNPHVEREQCVPECMGCEKMYSDIPLGQCCLEDHVCIAYISPKAIHRIGCALQTNRQEETTEKKKINPIKASKRSR
jgi:hypothetical protein